MNLLPNKSALKSIMLIVAITQTIYSQGTFETAVTASDGALDDSFGKSVSIHSNLAIIGTPGDDDLSLSSGSAYIFELVDGVWVEKAKLIGDDSTYANFGTSVAINDNFAVVGANFALNGSSRSGAVYVFKKVSGIWLKQQRISVSNTAQFGAAVAIYDSTIIVGASVDDESGFQSGAAYVYRLEGENWIEKEKIIPSEGGDNIFGEAVTLYGDHLIIGAPGSQKYYPGLVYFYKYNGNNWIEQKIISLENEATYLGHTVAINGDYAIIGARYKTYIFKLINNEWTQISRLYIEPSSVSINKDYFCIGSFINNGIDIGRTYIFKKIGNKWLFREDFVSDEAIPAGFYGYSSSLSGNRLIVGAWRQGAGKSYFYNLDFLPQVLRFEPEEVKFGNIYVGERDTSSVSITNFTSNIITFSSAAYTDSCFFGPIPSSVEIDSCVTYNIVFKPSTAGELSSQVKIINSSGENTIINLSGTGIFPLKASSENIDFGNRIIGTSETREVRIYNLTANSISISEVKITDGYFYTTFPDIIPASGFLNLRITFIPVTAGTNNGIFQLKNSNGTVLEINLTGTGLMVGENDIINVPTDYALIQTAIDSAKNDDIIQVAAGSYYEDLTIKKPVRIIGNGVSFSKIFGQNSSAPLIHIQSDSVKLLGLQLTALNGQNYESGVGGMGQVAVYVDSVKNCTLEHFEIISADGGYGDHGGLAGPGVKVMSSANIFLIDVKIKGGKGGVGNDFDYQYLVGYGTGGSGSIAIDIENTEYCSLNNLEITSQAGGYGTAQGGTGGKGIKIYNSNIIEIKTGNIFSGDGGDAYDGFQNLEQGDGGYGIFSIDSKNLTIADLSITGGNTLDYPYYSTLGLAGNGLILENNQSILIKNCTIKGGSAYGQGGEGTKAINSKEFEIINSQINGGNSGYPNGGNGLSLFNNSSGSVSSSSFLGGRSNAADSGLAVFVDTSSILNNYNRADFYAQYTIGRSPFVVNFYDNSVCYNSYDSVFEWDFNNDGIVDSNEKNPVWTYSKSGKYSVRFNVTNEVMSSSIFKENYIEVKENVSLKMEINDLLYNENKSKVQISISSSEILLEPTKGGYKINDAEILYVFPFDYLGKNDSLHTYCGEIFLTQGGIYSLNVFINKGGLIDTTLSFSFSATKMELTGLQTISSPDGNAELNLNWNKIYEDYYFVVQQFDINNIPAYSIFPNISLESAATISIIFNPNKYIDNEKLFLFELSKSGTSDLYQKSKINGYVFPNENRIIAEIFNTGIYSIIYDSTYVGSNVFPEKFEIYSNYPNPFNHETTIEFGVPEDSFISLNIYNILGQKVRTIINKDFTEGRYRMKWDGYNNNGQKVSSGLYFCVLKSNRSLCTRKILFVQ